MPVKKKGINHGNEKDGSFLLWDVAEFPLVLLANSKTPHLFQSSLFSSFPSNNVFTLPLECEDLENFKSKVLGVVSLNLVLALQKEGGRDTRMSGEEGEKCIFIKSTGRTQAFQSCGRYRMKTQATTTEKANTGNSIMENEMPAGSPSPRFPIGPFCTCNLCCTLRDTA